VPIELGDGASPVFLSLFGSGIRGRSSLSAVTSTLGDVALPVQFAGPKGPLVGLDQVNVGPLPVSLTGRGELNLVVMVDGKKANTVTASIK
jgi:uncharacterized protein (TIGR03437 family)